jgi:hypothetical protein
MEKARGAGSETFPSFPTCCLISGARPIACSSDTTQNKKHFRHGSAGEHERKSGSNLLLPGFQRIARLARKMLYYIGYR